MKSFREFIRDFDKKRLGASVRSSSIDDNKVIPVSESRTG